MVLLSCFFASDVSKKKRTCDHKKSLVSKALFWCSVKIFTTSSGNFPSFNNFKPAGPKAIFVDACVAITPAPASPHVLTLI